MGGSVLDILWDNIPDDLDIFHAKERNISDIYLWWMFNDSVRPIRRCRPVIISSKVTQPLSRLAQVHSVARMLCKEGGREGGRGGNTEPLLLPLPSSPSLSCGGSFDHLWPGETALPSRADTGGGGEQSTA